MSTRDWSEAYFTSESSVHGREALSLTDPVNKLQDVVANARWEYNKALRAKEEAIAALMGNVPALPTNVDDWLTDNEVAYEGRRTPPKWVADAVQAHDEAAKAAKSAATEAFLDSDDAEDIIDSLVKAKAAYDAALDAVDAANAAADSAYDDARNSTGWVICSSHNVASNVAKKIGIPVWSGKTSTVRDRMIVTVSQAVRITDPHNRDRFIPDSVIFHDPDSIRDIGFDRDIDKINRRVNG